MKNRELKSRVFGALSGLCLTIPQIWMVAAPLQLVAFLPVLYLASRKDTTYNRMIHAGVYMGIFYVIPQACVLQMPLIITLILFAELILVFSAFSLISFRLLRRPTLLSVFAIGALFVLLDWINFSAIPIWGMAQSIVRPWSAYPELVSFVSITGLTGIAFLIVTLQSLTVNLIAFPKQRISYILAAVALVLTFVTANIILQSNKPVDKIKVSAMGWTEDSNSVAYPEDSNSLYAKFVEQAAREDSKIVVSPELGFYTGTGDVNQWLVNFQEIAKNNNIALVIGVDFQRSNKAIIINSNGQISGCYTKTHITPFEYYEKGDGTTVIAPIEGTNLGVMICHDDNFTDLSRSYGRQKAEIVAVPTLDWAQVKNAHLQSSISRAIESNYSVIRACHNGISAIISPEGKIIKKMDHLTDSSGIITAEVPIYAGTTLFSLWGHWPVVPCFILLLIYVTKELIPRIKLNNKI